MDCRAYSEQEKVSKMEEFTLGATLSSYPSYRTPTQNTESNPFSEEAQASRSLFCVPSTVHLSCVPSL